MFKRLINMLILKYETSFCIQTSKRKMAKEKTADVDRKEKNHRHETRVAKLKDKLKESA